MFGVGQLEVSLGQYCSVLIKKQNALMGKKQAPHFSGGFRQTVGAALLGLSPLLATFSLPPADSFALEPQKQVKPVQVFQKGKDFDAFVAQISQQLEGDLKQTATVFPIQKYEEFLTRYSTEQIGMWVLKTAPKQNVTTINRKECNESVINSLNPHPYVAFLSKLANRVKQEKATSLPSLIEKHLRTIVLRQQPYSGESETQRTALKLTTGQILNQHYGTPTPLGTREYPFTLEQKLEIISTYELLTVFNSMFTVPYQRQELARWLGEKASSYSLEELLSHADNTLIVIPASNQKIPLQQLIQQYCVGLSSWQNDTEIAANFAPAPQPQKSCRDVLKTATEKLLSAHKLGNDAQAYKHLFVLQNLLHFKAWHSPVPASLFFTHVDQGVEQFYREEHEALPALMAQLYNRPSEPLVSFLQTLFKKELPPDTLRLRYLQQLNRYGKEVLTQLQALPPNPSSEQAAALKLEPACQNFNLLKKLQSFLLPQNIVAEPPASLQQELKNTHDQTREWILSLKNSDPARQSAILSVLKEREDLTRIMAADVTDLLQPSKISVAGGRWLVQHMAPHEKLLLQRSLVKDLNSLSDNFLLALQARDEQQAQSLLETFQAQMEYIQKTGFSSLLNPADPALEFVTEKWDGSTNTLLGVFEQQALQGKLSPALKAMLHSRHQVKPLDYNRMFSLFLDNRIVSSDALDFLREYTMGISPQRKQRWFEAINQSTDRLLEAVEKNEEVKQNQIITRLHKLLNWNGYLPASSRNLEPGTETAQIWEKQQQALLHALQKNVKEGTDTASLSGYLVSRSMMVPNQSGPLSKELAKIITTDPTDLRWLPIFQQTYSFIRQHYTAPKNNPDELTDMMFPHFISSLNHVLQQPPSEENQQKIRQILYYTTELTLDGEQRIRIPEFWQTKTLELLAQNPNRAQFDTVANIWNHTQFDAGAAFWKTPFSGLYHFDNLTQLDQFLRKASPEFDQLTQRLVQNLISGKPEEREAAAGMLMDLPRLIPPPHTEGFSTVELQAFLQRALCSGSRNIPQLAESMSRHPDWLNFERPEDFRLRARTLIAMLSWQGELTARFSSGPAIDKDYRNRLYGENGIFEHEAKKRYSQMQELLPPMLTIALQRSQTDPTWRSAAVEVMGDFARMYPDVGSTNTETAKMFPLKTRIAFMMPWFKTAFEQLEENPNSITAQEASVIPYLAYGQPVNEFSNRYLKVVQGLLNTSHALNDEQLTRVLAGLGQLKPSPEAVTFLFDIVQRPLPQSVVRDGAGQALNTWFLHNWMSMPKAQHEAFLQTILQKQDNLAPLSPSGQPITPIQDAVLRLCSLYRLGPEYKKLVGDRLIHAEMNLAGALSWGDFPPTGGAGLGLNNIPLHLQQKLPPELSPKKLEEAEYHMTQAFYKTFDKNDKEAMATYNQAFQSAQKTFGRLTRFLIENLDPVYTQNFSESLKKNLPNALETLTADDPPPPTKKQWALSITRQLGTEMLRIQNTEAVTIKGNSLALLFPLMQSFSQLERSSDALVGNPGQWQAISGEPAYTRLLLQQARLPESYSAEWQSYYLQDSLKRLVMMKTTGPQDISNLVFHPQMRYRNMQDYVQALSHRLLLLQTSQTTAYEYDRLENALYGEFQKKLESWRSEKMVMADFINTFLETPVLGATSHQDRLKMLVRMGLNINTINFYTSENTKEELSTFRKSL